MADEYSSNGQSRLDRLEGLMALCGEGHLEFQEEHRLLLTAQGVLTNRIDCLTQTVRELSERQKRPDERLNALIALVDDIVGKRPPQ